MLPDLGSRRTRALLAIWGTAGILAAPWAIDYTVRRLWRSPTAREGS